MANVEQVKGYVGPQPYDPKKEVFVDQKKFQEELNKKVQAGSEADKQEQQKKKHIAKGDSKEEDESKVVQGPEAPQVETAFSAYMEDDDQGPSILGASKRVISSESTSQAPLGAFEEDLSHIKEDIISTTQNVYDTPAPPSAPSAPTPALSPPPSPTPPAPTSTPPPVEVISSPIFSTDEELPPDMPPPPLPEEEEISTPPSPPPTVSETAPAPQSPAKPKVKVEDTSLMGMSAPKKESFKEKKFRKKVEAAKVLGETEEKKETPALAKGTPQKGEAPTHAPPLPPSAPPTEAVIQKVVAPQVAEINPPPLLPGMTKPLAEPSSKGRPLQGVHGISESKTIEKGESKGKSDSQPDTQKDQETEEEQVVIPLTGQVPLMGAAPLEKAAPTPYSALSPQIRELFDKMVGMITIQCQTGVTTTTVTVNLPNSPLQGVQIVLQQFDTARHSFNIQLEGTPEQLNLLNANVNDLAAAFAGGKYAFSANILTPQLITKSPHLIHRKESGGEKGEKQK
ncbi:MAG: hypothetical protein KBC64_06775 [Simkaniaceae bacterium]|nr:hypothetical protein [Simkaniaceae bacterium]